MGTRLEVTTFRSLRMLGARVHLVQIPDVIAAMAAWIQARPRTCRQIVVTGMHGLMEGLRDPAFKAILNRADLFVPDGISPVWVARLQGFRLPRRVCGSELLLEFCRVASQKGYRSFFYGDTEETLELLASRLRREFPGLPIAGMFSPPFRPLTPAEEAEIIGRINAARPDVLWVGLGLPKQERWIAQYREQLHLPVAVGVGAAFKFVSGQVRRAPDWMGDHGLEWLWRFAHEPRRLWRRVLLDIPQFVGRAVLEWSGLRNYD